jgi:hypothetical protein
VREMSFLLVGPMWYPESNLDRLKPEAQRPCMVKWRPGGTKRNHTAFRRYSPLQQLNEHDIRVYSITSY